MQSKSLLWLAHVAAVLISLAISSSAPAQSAAQLEKAAIASREALATVDSLRADLGALHRQTEQTLRVLRESQEVLKLSGMEQAATDLAALIATVEKTEEHLSKQIQTIDRIRTSGATDSDDPLGAVEARIAEAGKGSDPEKREDALQEILKEVQDSERLRPFVGLVHYQIGEVLRAQAAFLVDKGKRSSITAAKNMLIRATRSYDAAASEAVEEVSNTSIGSSSKASALCRLVQVHAALYLSVTGSQKEKSRVAANTSYRRLRHDYSDAMMDDQSRAVSVALRDVNRMR